MSDALQKLLVLIEGKDEASPAMKQAGESAKGLGSELTKIGQIASGVALGSAGFQIGMSLSEHFKDAITEVESFGDQVFKLQQRIAISSQSASGLLSVFERFGVSSDRAAQMMTFFSRGLRGTIDETEGGLLAVNSFNGVMAELGVSAVDAAGKFRPVDEVLAQVQERMSKLASDGENAARLTKLFGRAGGELAPAFNLSAQEFERFRVEAQRLGVTLSQDNVNQVRELAMAHHDLDEATRGLSIQTGLLVTGPLTALAKAAADAATRFNKDVVPAIKNAENEYKVWQELAAKLPPGSGGAGAPSGKGVDLTDPFGMRTAVGNMIGDFIKKGMDPLGMRTGLWNLLPLSEAHNEVAAGPELPRVGRFAPGINPLIAMDEINAAKAEQEAALNRNEQLKQLELAKMAGAHALSAVQYELNREHREQLDLVKASADAELSLIPIKEQQADLALQLLKTSDKRAQLEREGAVARAQLASMPSSAALEDNRFAQQLAQAQIKAGALAGRDISGAVGDLLAAKFAEPALEVRSLQMGRAVTLAERNQQAGQLSTDIATLPLREKEAELAVQIAQDQRNLDHIAAEQRQDLLQKTDKLIDLETQRRELEDKLFEVSQRQAGLSGELTTVNVTLTVNEASGQVDYDKLLTDSANAMVAALQRVQRTSGPGAPASVPGGRLQQGAEG